MSSSSAAFLAYATSRAAFSSETRVQKMAATTGAGDAIRERRYAVARRAIPFSACQTRHRSTRRWRCGGTLSRARDATKSEECPPSLLSLLSPASSSVSSPLSGCTETPQRQSVLFSIALTHPARPLVIHVDTSMRESFCARARRRAARWRSARYAESYSMAQIDAFRKRDAIRMAQARCSPACFFFASR